MEHIMVYGTLKEGFGNAYWMNGLSPIGECTAKDVVICSDGGLPYAVKRDGRTAHGELYETTMEHIEHLDLLEGHPVFYCREKGPVECNGETYNAWVYFCSEKGHLPEVEGMWK